MDYIAVKNKIQQTDILFVDGPIIDNRNSLIDLVQTWLRDMGCKDENVLHEAGIDVKNCYTLHYTHTETNRNNHSVTIDVYPDNNYVIKYTTVITKLTYKLR